jgi:mono/diheme cytochrome c family protein
MSHMRLLLVAASLFAALPICAQAPAAAPPSRGELLYTTHCVACHTTRVHWRDRRTVTDYPSLVAQVARWQANTGLGWSSEEIGDVAQYLGATIYRLPDAAPPQQS